MESSALNFQSALQSLTFKSFYHNQTQQFDYDNLFLNRRVIVFSVPSMFGRRSLQILKAFDEQRSELQGIDDVYCLSSNSQLIGPWSDKQSTIRGLYDTGEFVAGIAKFYNIDKPLADLKSFWQYMTIIDNGVPIQFWHNPIKANMSLHVVRHPEYAYHNMSVKKVKEYLANSK